ncbi:NAD(P)/FAD-dependent oxidoreductase [Desulfosporosinus fructosivorans]
MSNTMKLFEPIKIGNVEIKNRTALLPMSTELTNDHYVTDRMVDFYAQRAKGDVGLLTVGTVYVSDFRGTHPLYPPHRGAAGIWSDEFIPGWKKLTSAVRENGGKSCAQLNLYYEWRRSNTLPLEPVGPSEGPSGPFVSYVREATVEEIQIMISEFGDGARRAREAGFDVIELHAGIGYGVNRWLSPYSNKRTDAWGGSLENRMRFLLEIIKDCQAKAGTDIPLMVRLSADEYMPGGHTIEDTKKIIPILEKAGIVAFSIQAGFHESERPLVNQFVPDGCIVDLATECKTVTKLPVMAGYRIDSPEMANEIVTQGRADMVGFARALVADPDLVKKYREGRPETIRRCIVCSRCLDNIFVGKHLDCSVNAEVASTLGKPTPSSKRKKVAVIGAGPAGMEAARIAAMRGHTVTLFEKGSRLGGSWNLASILNYRLERPLAWYKQELAKLPIDIRLNTEVTETILDQLKADEIIVAPGGDPIIPDVPGVNGKNVLGGHDIKKLMDGIPPKKGLLWRFAAIGAKTFSGYHKLMRFALGIPWPLKRRLVVIGGGFAGCEVAFELNKGREVTIIEESKKIGYDIGPIDRKTELNILKQNGVRMEALTKVKEFTRNGVKIIKQDGTEGLIEADSVMLSLGVKENKKLYERLSKKFENVHLIGDGVGEGVIRRTREAIRDGYDIGMRI